VTRLGGFASRAFRLWRWVPEMEERGGKKSRGPRKPSLRTLIVQAEKAGKNVASITTPDGVTLRFGECEPTEPSNPWLADLNKGTKQ
jgi:hypothetical protein